jgi:putative membrane-bound dehydrogenase-like protein
MKSRCLKACPLFGTFISTLLLIFDPAVRAEEPLPSVERLKTSPVLRHLQPNLVPAAPRTAAEQTVAQMYVPEGFRAELVVAEPELHQPVAFAFDDRGRIWVAEAYSYPQKQPAGQGLDKIVIFEDRDGDGRFESRKVFAEQLNLVSGFELGFGGVWVGAAPELLFIADRNRDDVPDGPPQVLLDGYGFQDTHECLNSFLWGPDGWLYGIQGVFNLAHIGKPGAPDADRKELRAGVWRYHPVRHEFEIFAHGGSNPWGIDYDEHGQLFMTHCRSYWGRGGTTHVLQGGHFWNQANANYAPFIIANPPSDFAGFRNFLLASARYDHGAGGAGAPGSDAIYGGHSHVGTMVYLGDNWPEEYRGHLFTHNLGGHQINQQVNRRWGSGFDTVHAGRDQFFCSDPKYVAVDLQYGPDGAVYIIDWYDQQHCHNPNTERWDRSNGRIYRLQWQATYKPVQVNLGSLSDIRLVELLRHKNEWYGRTARRLLQERAQSKRAIDAKARRALTEVAQNDLDPIRRLHALWTLHAIGGITDSIAKRALADSDEFVRGWMIQLSLDNRSTSEALLVEFVRLAQADPSPVVRRYLASAIQRSPRAVAWELSKSLSQHGEDREDRNLPMLLWHGMAPLVVADLDYAFAVAKQTLLPQLADWTYWYAATMEGDGLNRSIARLEGTSGEEQRRSLAGIALALESRANVPAPAAWKHVAPKLHASRDSLVQRQAERLAAAFGDDSMFPRLREVLADKEAGVDARKHAFAVLGRAQDRSSVPVFIRLLEEGAFRIQALNLLSRFDNEEISRAIITRLESFNAGERNAALNTLASRPSFALALLDALAAGKVKRDLLTAFHIRQFTQLKNPEIDKRVTAAWGRIAQSPAEKETQIAKLEKTFNEAPLWAYDARAGRQHFQKLCAQCHRIGEEGARLGPELTGTGKNGIRYLLENIVDPNAVIGTDFQMTTVETKAGDVISGILTGETSSAVTIRTTVGESVVAKSDIGKRETGERSLMPEGLIESLKDREQLELLKFLSGN